MNFKHYNTDSHDQGLSRHPYIFLPGANLWASVKIPPPLETVEEKSVNFGDKLAR